MVVGGSPPRRDGRKGGGRANEEERKGEWRRGKKVEGVNEGGTRGLDKVPQTREGERPRALSAQSPRLLLERSRQF